MRRIKRLVPALLALFLLAPAIPAAATHNQDDHTQNMHLMASLPKNTGDPAYRNSDLAFWGKLAYAGNYEGFRIIDISAPGNPKTLVDYFCPGSQHDVSVWENLMFLSIDRPRTGPACDSDVTPVVGGAVQPGWEGIRIFDVSNPRDPQYIKGVGTDCGSHTHTLVPDTDNGRVLLYISSYPTSGLGRNPYGNADIECFVPHSKISVVEIPLDSPEDSEVVSEPELEFEHPHEPSGSEACHDITVFMEPELAAAACMGEAQPWDISDLENPEVLANVFNENVGFWHSSAFTWDGEVIVFGDEFGGGTQPWCKEGDPTTTGALWFYSVEELMMGHAEPLGHFKIPRPQEGNCTAHNFNVLAHDKGYVLASSWYDGGTSMVDFTDPVNPVEIGYYDGFDPRANTWSSYYYNGHVYANDTFRGFEIFRFSDKARAGAKKFPYLNAQTQEDVLFD